MDLHIIRNLYDISCTICFYVCYYVYTVLYSIQPLAAIRQ